MAVLGDPEPEDCKEAGLGKAGFEMVLPSGGVWKVDCNLDLSGACNFNPSGNLGQASRSCWIEPGCWQGRGEGNTISAELDTMLLQSPLGDCEC